jgi:hypothetical protein
MILRLPKYCLYGICFAILSAISEVASFRSSFSSSYRLALSGNLNFRQPSKHTHRAVEDSDTYDGYEGEIEFQDYYPTSGVETFISTIGANPKP